MSDLRLIKLKDISFSASDGTRCDSFIEMLTGYAVQQDKVLDDEWIAEVAGMRLFGRALRWYNDLSEETQGSWKKLRRAMIRRWPSNEEQPISAAPSLPSIRSTSSNSMTPIPAAAPPQTSLTASTIPTVRRGYIRIIAEDPFYSGYLSRHHGVYLNMKRTSDKVDAVQAEFYPSDKLYEIKLLGMNNSPESWLGLHWRSPPEFSSSSVSDGAIVNLVRSQYGSLVSPSKQMAGSVNATAWLVGFDGTLFAIQKTGDWSQHQLDLCLSKDDDELGFAVSYESFLLRLRQLGHGSILCKAKLVFEEVTTPPAFSIPAQAQVPAPVPVSAPSPFSAQGCTTGFDFNPKVLFPSNSSMFAGVQGRAGRREGAF